MNIEQQKHVPLQEKRLIATMITGKPRNESFVITAATLALMLLATLFYWSDPLGWSQFLPAIRQPIFANGEWWRIFTAIFIHADWDHFFSNMYMLAFFSFFVFGYFGFGVFPLLSFFTAGIVNLLSISTYPPDVTLLGSSGLVYLLGGFWLTLYFFIQRQYGITNRLLRVVGIGAVIFFPTSFVPATSYRTHAIGFVFGTLMALAYFIKNKKKIQAYEVYKVIYE
jgi:rhomboid protease GluP